ncbi:MAG: hypothetical protein QXV37_01815 [Candidatus Jordarchaeaceae archaeon]
MIKQGAERKNIIVRVRLEPRIYALLRKKATITNRSISEIIRFYIRKGLKEENLE